MFDLAQIWELLKAEPGGSGLQSLILFGIWWTSRGIRSDLRSFKSATDDRFTKIEARLTKGGL